MTDEGTTYEAFGNTTKLPAGDAGGQAITSEYYVDGQAYKQTQSGQTSEYKLDPEDRILETKASATVTDHYDAPGNGIAWTSEPGKWERRIPGIEGGLAAIQTGTAKADVTLQLHDLQGNIVATVEDSETATKLATTYNSTEFGAPNSKGEPPKFAYQGASGITSESSTGRIVQDGITYVPQTGAMLEPPEDLSPATPTNHNAAYVSNPNNPADQAGAQDIGAQIARREQENWERAEASRPQGTTPAPTGEGNGGAGAIGGGNNPNELGFHTLGPLALSQVGCTLESTMGFERSTQILIKGYVSCQNIFPRIVFQLCLGVYGLNGQPYVSTECAGEGSRRWLERSNTSGFGTGFWADCGSDQTYTVWIWAAVYGVFGAGGEAQTGEFRGYAKNVCSAAPILPA